MSPVPIAVQELRHHYRQGLYGAAEALERCLNMISINKSIIVMACGASDTARIDESMNELQAYIELVMEIVKTEKGK